MSHGTPGVFQHSPLTQAAIVTETYLAKILNVPVGVEKPGLPVLTSDDEITVEPR